MIEQLTKEERDALYRARKGKKQRLTGRVVFKSKAVMVQKGKGEKAGQTLRTTHTATAVRGTKKQYEGVVHEPDRVIVETGKS